MTSNKFKIELLKTNWISEKDNGIWDASNKGVILAKGKFIGLLDSGDTLSQNASEILKRMFKLCKNFFKLII